MQLDINNDQHFLRMSRTVLHQLISFSVFHSKSCTIHRQFISFTLVHSKFSPIITHIALIGIAKNKLVQLKKTKE
jgi:hypothetical protein